MPVEPMIPRFIWPRRLLVLRALGNSLRQDSQITSGIRAKKERKNTSSPVG